jgi:putative ABC transport system permease protein
MISLPRDLRHTIRTLARRPAFAATAIATIALAIGANTLMFALIRAVLLKPLPLPEPDRLVRVEQVHQSGPSNVTGATFRDLQARTTTLASVAAFRVSPATLSAEREAVQASATTMTSGYFTVLGVTPRAGRLPAAEDFVSGGAPVVFIDSAAWRRFFSHDPSAIGRILLVNAVPRIVAGVIDVPSSIPGAADVWLPYPDDAPLLMNRRARLFTVVGRLRPGISVSAASSELDNIARQVRHDAPEAGMDLSLRATSLAERIVQPIRSALVVLWAAVGVLLLIAFANVSNLLLMQGTIRARELSLRTALGASRATLVRQLALESVLLGVAGGVTGAAIGAWGLTVLRAALPPLLPRVTEVRADATVVLPGIALSLVASILFGLVPAIRASRRDAAASLRSRHGEQAGSRLRDIFVAAQVALTLVLLFGAGLLGRSLLAVTRVPLGFDPSDVTTADLSLPSARYDDAAAHARFYARLLEQMSGVQGLDAIGVTGALPLSPTAATTMIPQDGRSDQQADADVITATPGLFTALRIPLVRGRSITDLDRSGAQPVALVNETAARQFWPAGVDPIGRTIEMRDWGSPYSATVIGIVGDVHQAGPDQPSAPAVYYPLAQFPETTLMQTVVVRSRVPLERVIGGIRDAVARIDAAQPIALAAAMPERIASALAPRRFNLLLLGAFASSALLLAAVGIYGIVAFAMAARTREIGIRMALGAAPRHIVRLAVVRGVVPVLFGVTAGAVASLAVSRALAVLVFGVATHDAASLGIAIALVIAAGLAAIAGPARRVLRVDPAIALQAE